MCKFWAGLWKQLCFSLLRGDHDVSKWLPSVRWSSWLIWHVPINQLITLFCNPADPWFNSYPNSLPLCHWIFYSLFLCSSYSKSYSGRINPSLVLIWLHNILCRLSVAIRLHSWLILYAVIDIYINTPTLLLLWLASETCQTSTSIYIAIDGFEYWARLSSYKNLIGNARMMITII